MMAEFNVDNSRKRAKLDVFCLNLCVFCSEPFTKKNPAVSPDVGKLDSLFSACTQREDEVGKGLLDHRSDILNQSKTFRYHRDCRSTYCSPHHIQRALKQRENSSHSSNESGSGQRDDGGVLRRSQLSVPYFDWIANCFICGTRCHTSHRYSSGKGNWSLVATAIKDTPQNIYSKVLLSAERQDDQEMLKRLRGVGPDLVAADARYHQRKNCLPNYIKTGEYASNATPNVQHKIHLELIKKLKEEYYVPIMVDKGVFLLTTLIQRYHEFASEAGVDNPLSYSSQHLKQHLIKEWPEISFVPQPGLSDFVCSKEIYVGDALIKIKELSNILELVQEETDVNVLTTLNTTDDSIIHMAVGILRRRIQHTKKLKQEYYSSQEMTVQAAKQFLDPLLLKAVGWLTDENLYVNAADISDTENSSKCVNIACDIVSLATKIPSPKHLGLSIHLHHEFGSRKLIDEMYQLGYGISYTEFRKFLTSAAVHIGSGQQQGPSGSLIPPELVHKTNGGTQVIAVGDNWDHNERTVDGKRTTHAMTSIIITPQSQTIEYPRLPRLAQCTYNISTLPGGNLSQVLRYKKPVKRPEPKFEPPPSVDEIKPDKKNKDVQQAKKDEIIYNLVRSIVMLTGKNPEVHSPPWGPYHFALSDTEQIISTVAYNPILMAPPTDLATIYTTLKRCKEIANGLGHTYTPIFFDMGLLAKALEVTWSKPDELEGVIPCEGGMHLLMSVMAGIGYLYGDAGLRNILHESGVFAAGTVQQILTGKDFSRALYALKLIDEVLHFQLLKNFKAWCETKNKTLDKQFLNILHDLQVILTDSENSPSQISEIMNKLRHLVEITFLPLLDQFCEEGRQMSPTFKLWYEYLQQVSIPFKVFLSASREGNWNAFQSAKAEFLPLLFASNRNVYAKYMPILLLKMKRLPMDFQDSFQKDHQFVAKLSEGKFNMVWPDYVLESTENKDLKGTGGIIGLTLRDSALARWFLARPVTARYSSSFHENFCKPKKTTASPVSYHSGGKAEIKRWNTDMKKLKDIFNDTYLDPFNLQEPPARLVNFATGVVARPDIQDSLLGALTKGAVTAEKFVTERLVPNEDQTTPPKSFYQTMTRSGVKTMAEMTKSVKIGKRDVQMNADVMYLRLLAINAKKKVPLKRVLSFENAPVPLSLFSEDGKMWSGTKSHFMHKLEDMLSDDKITSVSDIDCIIWDGHAVIQMQDPEKCIKTQDKITFNNMAASFMTYILGNDAKNSQQIHVVFDQYLEDSIKSHTREKRTQGMHANVVHVLPDVAIPKNWNLFLSRGENKGALAKYYTEVILKEAGTKLNNAQSLFVSGSIEDSAIKISKASVSHGFDPLKSNQEEADTRLVLHAAYAADQGAKTVVVSSPDTDVLVLLIHHRQAIHAEYIYFLTGHEGKHTSLTRYIPVHKLYEKLTQEQNKIILSVYCMTGCDTVSAFHGHGKKSAFNLMIRQAKEFQHLGDLGSSAEVSNQQTLASTKFVSLLYGKECDSLNLLRCEKAENNIPNNKLPPTENSFNLHILRACYQLLVWRQALTAYPNLPDPILYGYEKNSDNELHPKLMSQPASAPELLNNLVCSCDDYCSSGCTCSDHNQPCSIACQCEALAPIETEECEVGDIPVWCANPLTIDITTNDSDSDSEDLVE